MLNLQLMVSRKQMPSVIPLLFKVWEKTFICVIKRVEISLHFLVILISKTFHCLEIALFECF